MAKSPTAFRTISEAAEEIGTPQHVLRFWETKFDFLQPVKRAGGRRFYRPEDVILIKGVRRLLHDEGLTIRGVQRLYKEQGRERFMAYGDPEGLLDLGPEIECESPGSVAPAALDSQRLSAVLADLEQAKARLDAVLKK